jgi:hypothetical protein
VVSQQKVHGPAQAPTKTPMCDKWYEGVKVLPWIARLSGCRCGVSAQALPEQHGSQCPVRLYREDQ